MSELTTTPGGDSADAPRDTPEWPMVSVVMPIRNEAESIHRSAGAVLAQDYPRDRMELLVADGMSTDQTRAIVEGLDADGIAVRIIDNPGQIVPTGLNRAIEAARGEIIVRVDGHTIIAEDYVRQCVSELLRTGADNVGGKMAAVGTTPFGRAVAEATSSPFGIGGARFHYSDEEEWVDTVYLGTWRKDLLLEIGGFDEEMVRNQDDELNYRLRKNGGRILLSPRIRSTYFPRATPRALWRQYFQYGFWKVRVMQKHPWQMRLRHFIPPLFALAILVFVLLSLLHGAGPPLLLGLIGTYFLVNLGICLFHSGASKTSFFTRMMIYTTLHLSYGFGFLLGLVKFARQW